MLNELLKEKLQHLNEDELMLVAIKEVFNERIDKEKPNIETSDDNTVLGEKYRAYHQAIKLFDKILTDINSYKITNTNSKPINKGK